MSRAHVPLVVGTSRAPTAPARGRRGHTAAPGTLRRSALAALAAVAGSAMATVKVAPLPGAVTPAKPAAASHRAVWTGRVIQARTPSYALAWNCQYQLGTRFYWRLSVKPACPARITIK